MQKAEQQEIAQPLESLNDRMELPWVPSWLMVSNINQKQGEFPTGKLFFFVFSRVLFSHSNWLSYVKPTPRLNAWNSLRAGKQPKAPALPFPRFRWFSSSAFEKSAGQIEIFFCGLFFEKNAGFQPFLIFIHVHPSWSDGTACMILVHVPCVLPWPCRTFSPKLRWWRQMARPFRRASQ